ncbi:MAG: aminoacyl-tRNA hydrolase [Campylobacterales bacterium]
MWLIVGLGNPGNAYRSTRHNIGFMAVDHLIDRLHPISISKSTFHGECYKINDLLLLKPSTFMNRSGESVHAVANYYKIDLDRMIVIHDDIDLGFGALRFKRGGGHGGHNGLRSIDQHCGAGYLRVRVGIGKPATKDEVANYVLAPFSPQEQHYLDDLVAVAAQGAMELTTKPLEYVSGTMTRKPIDVV